MDAMPRERVNLENGNKKTSLAGTSEVLMV
jgi:hypothetical protein